MKNKFQFILLLIVVIILTTSKGFSQSGSKLSVIIRTETIEKLSKMLTEFYVNPETGKKMAKQLNDNLKDGKYNKIDEFGQFAFILTADLYEISKDNHLNIVYSPEGITYFKKLKTLSESERIKNSLIEKAKESKNNFGFEKIEIISDNIGYLRLTTFADVDYAAETANAAMNFLSNTEEIIIDLRDNNGGWPSMMQLLASYFYDYSEGENTVLMEQHINYSNQVVPYRILPYIPGKRMAKTPLYILVNKNSISAAEGFAFGLQKLRRATIIGEHTNFGAHCTRGPEILNDYFLIKLPVGNMISPITKTSWEGVGVEPDIKTESKDALDATLKIIRAKRITDKPTEKILLPDEGLKQYIGTYEFNPENTMVILVNGSQVFTEITGGPGQFEIFPLEKDKFNVPGIGIEVDFILEKGIVTGLNFTRNGKVNYAKKIK